MAWEGSVRSRSGASSVRCSDCKTCSL
ncbi:hypothetical protein [Streptomyces sp. NPDC050560]